MPPVTRYSDMLYIIDGLFFINQDIIELASRFYREPRSIMATFGEGAVGKLVPHVSLLMTTLNDLSKQNSDLKLQVESLTDNLASAEHRCISAIKTGLLHVVRWWISMTLT